MKRNAAAIETRPGIEARPGFPGAGRAPGGVGGHVGAPHAVLVRPRPIYEAAAPIVHRLLALVALLASLPVFVVVAIVVKATSPGPVFYCGERVGRGQRRFRIRKFRTMVDGAERDIGGRLASDADKDRYCTRVGRLLKKSKLDELPQLVNVLRGEMRLVGPRPVRPVFLERFKAEIPGYAARFLVPPGITGVAQLRGGYYTAPRDKLRYDLLYIAHRSLRLDLQVVLLTFVKVLNRWLSMGLPVLVLFLFVSLVPAGLHADHGLSVFGVRVSAVALAIATVAVWAAVRRRSTDLSLYRCPLNTAIVLFLVLAVLSALTAADPRLALQGAGYYLGTGLLVAFLIVNSLASPPFFTLAVRTVALTSVAVSLVGLLRLFLLNYGGAAVAGADGGEMPRLDSVVGSPVELAIYLVLGIPVLLAEVTAAETRRARDFWVVCTTISCVGIFFTQTRMGLLALLVTAVVFLRRRGRVAVLFTALFVAAAAVLAVTVSPRLTPGEVLADVRERIAQRGPELAAIPGQRWVLGGGATAITGDRDPDDRPGVRGDGSIPNMHVTLVLEHGLAGWLLFMWTIVSALRHMKRAHDRLRDARLRRTLWAIMSSVVGFLVSMNAMNTFHHLPIQIFFWTLLGIGLAIVVHRAGPRPRNMIWRFGDAGD